MGALGLGVVVGLLGGLGGTYFVLNFGRRYPQLHAAVSRVFLGGSAQGVPLSQEAVRDVEQNDPDLAAVIESAPAVPVATVPEEVTRPTLEAIEAAPTPEAAVEIARKFILDPDIARAITTLVRWRTRSNNRESQYQNSFRAFANKDGYAGKLQEKQRIPWGGPGGSRVAVPDFLLDDRVLVELKADLQASDEADRAMGQMLRYLLAWKDKGPAVLAICGSVSPEIRFLVRLYVNTWRKQLNLPVTVFFKQGEAVAHESLEMPAEAPRLERAE